MSVERKPQVDTRNNRQSYIRSGGLLGTHAFHLVARAEILPTDGSLKRVMHLCFRPNFLIKRSCVTIQDFLSASISRFV